MSKIRIAFIGLLAVAIVALTGCGPDGASTADESGVSTVGTADPTAGDAASASSSDVLSSEPAGQPLSESSGPEQPAKRSNSGSSIQLASLPIGGGPDDVNPQTLCVQLVWLTNVPIPAGVSVSVTGARLLSGNYFEVLRSGCPGRTSCFSSFTFTSANSASGEGQCYLPVRKTSHTGAFDTSVELKVQGTARCEAGLQATCAAFEKEAKLGAATIHLTVPTDDSATTDPGQTPTADPPTTDGSNSGSTEETSSSDPSPVG